MDYYEARKATAYIRRIVNELNYGSFMVCSLRKSLEIKHLHRLEVEELKSEIL